MDFSIKRLDLLRLTVPYFFLALLLLLSMARIPMPGAGLVKPHLVLMYIYYWAIYRPTLIPPALCFIIGLALDLMAAMPLGLHALIYVSVRWLVTDQRRFLLGQPYIVIWLVFALLTAAASMLQWALLGLPGLQWPPVMPVLVSTLVTLFLFPFLTMAMFGIHKVLPASSRL